MASAAAASCFAQELALTCFLVRFDGAYSVLFKAPGKIVGGQYPNILRWAREVSEIPGIQDTIDLNEAVGSYYKELFMLNPSGIAFKGAVDVSDLFGSDRSMAPTGEVFHRRVLT